jgi:hypothetical protein
MYSPFLPAFKLFLTKPTIDFQEGGVKRIISVQRGACSGQCVLLGLVRKAKGLRGQGERVSQMLASRTPLAAERKAEQKQC